MSAPEATLRRHILDALHAAGYYAMKNNVGTKGHVKYGLGPGSADIIVVVPVQAYSTTASMRVGRLCGLEIKLPVKGAAYTKVQQDWARDMNARGAYVVVVRSVEEALAAVQRAARGEAA